MTRESFADVPDKKSINNAIIALKKNGIECEYISHGAHVKRRIAQLIPAGSQVMTMTSVTLHELGITEEIDNSGNYDSVRHRLSNMDRESQDREMQQLGAAPEYAIGSVHAITEEGNVLIASNTGSQLPAYVYGAKKVIWVVGAQKVVKDVAQGMKRIYDYVLPLESERARKAYGVEGSFVSKLLIVNKEVTPGRIHIIIVDEKLGY